jgi:hypothetical protein
MQKKLSDVFSKIFETQLHMQIIKSSNNCSSLRNFGNCSGMKEVSCLEKVELFFSV